MNVENIKTKLNNFYCVPSEFGAHEICNLRERIKWIPRERRSSKYRPLNKLEWNYAFDESVPHVKFENLKRKHRLPIDINIMELEKAKKTALKKK